MKLFKVVSIVTALVVVVSLSSCSKNSDNLEEKWQEWVGQVNTEIAASVGSYNGYLYTKANETAESKAKMDSIIAVWSINSDSTIDLQNVPAALLVKQLPETQKALQTAISNMGNVNIHVKLFYNYYYCSPLVMYVYPQYVTFPIEYEGASHRVKIYFRSTETASNSLAQYMMKDDTGYVHKCMVELYPESLYMDDKLQTQFYAEAYLVWLGAKKEVQ